MQCVNMGGFSVGMIFLGDSSSFADHHFITNVDEIFRFCQFDPFSGNRSRHPVTHNVDFFVVDIVHCVIR